MSSNLVSVSMVLFLSSTLFWVLAKTDLDLEAKININETET